MKINSKWVRDMDIKSLSIEQLERVVIEDFSTTNPNTSIFKIYNKVQNEIREYLKKEYPSENRGNIWFDFLMWKTN